MYRSSEQKISDSLEYLDPNTKEHIANELEAYAYRERWGINPSYDTDNDILTPLVEILAEGIALLANTVVDAYEGAFILYKYIKKYKSIK